MTRRFIHSCVVLPAMLLAVDTASAAKVKMPMRGDAFADGQTYFYTGGHSDYNCSAATPASQRECQLDIYATRWAGNQWVDTIATPTGDGLTDQLIFGQPLYSPVDGEIISCWRNMPDNPMSGTACPGCALRGNNVLIETEEGHAVLLAHFREGSIPPELCPNDGVALYDSEANMACRSYPDMQVFTPIPVIKGQYLGDVGNSGGGSPGPHVHMEMYEFRREDHELDDEICVEDDLPIEFVESWSQDRAAQPADALDWNPLEGERLSFASGEQLLWPDPIGPRVDTLELADGTRPAIAMTYAGGVVAFRNDAGNLEVSAFDVAANETLVPGNAAQEGPVDDIAIAKIGAGSRHVVVAVENGAGKLQLIPYFVTTNEGLVRGNGHTGAVASRVALTRSPQHSGVVAAIRNGDGTLTVADYNTTISGDQITLTSATHDRTEAPIQRVAVDRVVAGRGVNESSGAFKGVVTAERRGDDRLAVRTWSVSASGTVTLVDSVLPTWGGSPLLVEEVAVSVVGSDSREYAVVSMRAAGSDTLRTRSYEISSTGQLALISSVEAGEIGALASTAAGNADLIAGVVDSDGDLLGASFEVRPNFNGSGVGGRLRRTGSRSAYGIERLDVGARADAHDVVFAVEAPGDEIHLLRYLTNYDTAQ